MFNNDISIQLTMITQQINRYAPIFLLLLGIFGNLLNCLIFIQRKLRRNPCSLYFLTASLGNLILFLSGFISRIIDGWKPEFNLTSTILTLCQLQVFLVTNSRSIATWMVAFASVDRYLVSSPNVHRRQMSNLKNVYRCILFVCIILSIVWLEVIFCFDANMVGAPFRCFIKSNACRTYNDVSQALITIICPIIVMSVFGFYTIKNIHQRSRVVPTLIVIPIVLRNRRDQRSLTKMLFIQMLIVTILTLPFALIRFYLTYTFYRDKSFAQKALEDFMFNIIYLIAFIPNCISFFLYVFSSSLFRETFIDLGNKIIHHLTY